MAGSRCLLDLSLYCLFLSVFSLCLDLVISFSLDGERLPVFFTCRTSWQGSVLAIKASVNSVLHFDFAFRS